jgi:uncharacterized damage-inducible protein DinB
MDSPPATRHQRLIPLDCIKDRVGYSGPVCTETHLAGHHLLLVGDEMKLTSVILEQLDHEAELTRRALERVPEGKNDWKPHPKSMPMGQLAHMVATMPSWISMIVKQDEIDIKPTNGAGNGASRNFDSTEALVQALDKAVADAKQAVSQTTDAQLQTPWKSARGRQGRDGESALSVSSWITSTIWPIIADS